MENKSNGLLKVAGILMIIGGIAGIIVGIIALIGVGVLAALGANSGLLSFAVILVIVGAIVQLIAGIVGSKNAAKPEKAQTCVVFGIIVIALSVLGTILGLVAGGSFNVLTLVTGLAVPILYLIGAFQNKAKAASAS